MGSCQSKPGSGNDIVSNDAVTESKGLPTDIGTKPNATVTLYKSGCKKSNSSSEEQEEVQESDTTAELSGSDRYPDSLEPSPKHNNGGRTRARIHAPHHEGAITQGIQLSEAAPTPLYHMEDTKFESSATRRLSYSKIRPGYSSGGSSDYSDEPERSNHLVDWKHELRVDGDVCKGVVRMETDFGRPIDEVYEGVHDGPILGSGVAGIVRQVKHRETGVNYAVKCMDLGLISDEARLKAFRDEIFIMCQLDHPNIVRLEEVYESDSEIYLIQELCHGGDLFDRLDQQPDYHYSEANCARLVKQMLSSIRYLHSSKIIHRDLKLENFLFQSTHPDSELKMIDFGLSKHFAYSGELQHECVGTPYTVAPEIIRAEYDEKVDLWALGVITYLLLSGETPFGGAEDGENLMCVRNNILRGQVVFEPEELWAHVSETCKQFIKRLLNPGASQRPTAKEAQLDPWLQIYGKRGATINTRLDPKIAKALVEYKEYSDMRKLLCEVLSFTLLPEQISDLRSEFEKADPDGEGEISIFAFKQVLIDSAESGALGALTESEVEDIFNAIRVRKSRTKIRWHEFIAAGLSQCNFDERNLKLAFDRLDFDRKGFINLDDMKELLGISSGDEDEELVQMWQDGLDECACPLGRITYDDFRMFVKGQKKDREPGSPGRRSFGRKSLEPSPLLQAVPEGSVSPQAKEQVFARFEEISALESLKMPVLASYVKIPDTEKKPKQVDIRMPLEPAVPTIPHHKRARSRSLGEIPNTDVWLDELEDVVSPTRKSSYVVLPSRTIGALQEVINDDTKSPLAFNRILYRKHREFRQSVLEASRLFDQKRQARKAETLEKLNLRPTFERGPSLVMRRGSWSKRQGGVEPPAFPVLPSERERNKKVEDAAKRSGRPRRRREKTRSDISGMMREDS